MDPSTEEDWAAIKFAEELLRYMHTSPYHLTSAGAKSGASVGEQSRLQRKWTWRLTFVEIDRYSDRYLVHLQAADKKGKLHAINTGKGMPRSLPPCVWFNID